MIRRGLRRAWRFAERHAGSIVGLSMAGVFLLGVAYSAYLGDALRYLPDEQDYLTLARNLARDGSYSLDGSGPSAYRAPGYPFFLSLFVLLGAGVVHLRALNFLLLAACVYLVYRLVAARSPRPAAALGALLTVGYPVLFYTAGTLYPQTLGGFLLLLLLTLLTRRRVSRRAYLLSGLTLGSLVLTVPTSVFVAGVLVAWFWFARPRLAFKRFLLTLAVAALVIGAWTVRNYVAFDAFVFVSSNSGINLLLGNSENTKPNAGVNVDISAHKEAAAQLDEIERDAYYRSRALEFVIGHPGQAAKLYVQKFLNYFNYRNRLYTRSEGSGLKDGLVLVTYGPLLSLALVRWLLARRVPLSAFEVLLFALYLSSALFTALFFTRIRFRVPFDFLLIVLVAMFLSRLYLGRFGSSEERSQVKCA
jgi:4-amino-4-deoxy-L-arabinose transferase-like glycosyltransferase